MSGVSFTRAESALQRSGSGADRRRDIRHGLAVCCVCRGENSGILGVPGRLNEIASLLNDRIVARGGCNGKSGRGMRLLIEIPPRRETTRCATSTLVAQFFG